MYTKLCPKSDTKPYPETEIGARHVASAGTELAWNVQGQMFNNNKKRKKEKENDKSQETYVTKI